MVAQEGESRAMMDHISLVVIGHVDSGKSTTTGHLLAECGEADSQQLARLEKQANQAGKGSFKYAWLTDSHAERERGITIDMTAKSFKTATKQVTIIDAPGHRDFVKNTITGAAGADAAMLIVSAIDGEFQAGMSRGGQTREHALLAFTMGIRQVVVAVNKMDMVEYSREKYRHVVSTTEGYLRKIGYSPDNIKYIPVSGWTGENMVRPAPTMPWNETGTLIEALDAIISPKRQIDKPLRMTVQQVFKVGGIGTVVVGRVSTGILRTGMPLRIAPSNILTEVKGLEKHHEALLEAVPGDVVGVALKNVAHTEVRRGHVLSDSRSDPALACKSFTAELVILSHPGEISPGYSPVLDMHTAHVACTLQTIHAKIDRRTGKPVAGDPPKFLKAGDAASVEFVPRKPLCVEPYRKYPGLARFAVRDMKSVVGVGVIREVSSC